MRRHTLILFAALLLAAVPAAAQYTQYFQGDQITIGETEVGAVLVACDNLPWSFPESENYVWHGWVQANPDQLTLRFDVIYEASHGVGHLIGVAPREWREGKVFPWEDGMRAYARIYPNENDPTHLSVEVVSVHGNYANLFDAGLVFTGAPPIWWELDPEHWLIQWEVVRFPVLVKSIVAVE